MTDHHPYSKRALAASLASTPREQLDLRQRAEAWLESLNVVMIEVWFLCDDKTWQAEKHVNDVATLQETTRMTMERQRCFYCVWQVGEECWMLHRMNPPLLRTYETREAAEMVAILNG